MTATLKAQITALCAEAATAGDLDMVKICKMALGGVGRPPVRGVAWTRESAVAECQQVIAEAAAVKR